MRQEEIIKALTELGYPLEELRQYPWFRRGELHPDINIDNRNVWSQGVEYDGQEYLVPGVATLGEMYGIPHALDEQANIIEEVPREVTSQKIYLGENWGIEVDSPDEGTMLGELISKYMGSLSGF